jgi:hypothetical protein
VKGINGRGSGTILKKFEILTKCSNSDAYKAFEESSGSLLAGCLSTCLAYCQTMNKK